MHHFRLMGAGLCCRATMLAGIRRNRVMGRSHPMVTRAIAIQALDLGKRGRPAADQGAEESKGKDGETHNTQIEAVDVD